MKAFAMLLSAAAVSAAGGEISSRWGGDGGGGGPGFGFGGDDCLNNCLTSFLPASATATPFPSAISSLCGASAIPNTALSACLAASCTAASGTHTRSWDDAAATEMCDAFSSCSALSASGAATALPSDCVGFRWGGENGGNGGGPGGPGGPWGAAGWGGQGPHGWYTVSPSGTRTAGWTTRTETVTTTRMGTAGAAVTEAVAETRTGSVVAAAVVEGTATVATPTAAAGRLEGGVLGLGGLLGVGLGVALVL